MWPTHPALCVALNRYQHGCSPGTERETGAARRTDVIRLMLQSHESAATRLAAGAGKAVLAPTYDPSRTCACTGDRGQHLPFFRAWAMTSAALLLITLVMYRGQLVWLAMVMERFTASASTCRRASQCENCVHCSVSPLSSCLPSTHREGLQ